MSKSKLPHPPAAASATFTDADVAVTLAVEWPHEVVSQQCQQGELPMVLWALLSSSHIQAYNRITITAGGAE